MVKGFAGNIKNQSHRMQPCKREDERSRILKKNEQRNRHVCCTISHGIRMMSDCDTRKKIACSQGNCISS
jgi:hypothetical protein